MYVISRRDIPLAQQAVQAAHAGIEYAFQYGRPIDHHPSYIHLTVKNQQQLIKLRQSFNDAELCTAEFHEPYQDWGLTAIACIVEEKDRKLCKGLRLWKLPTQEVS